MKIEGAEYLRHPPQMRAPSKGHDQKKCGRRGKRQTVDRADAEHQRVQESGRDQRRGKARADSGGDQRESARHHQPQDQGVTLKQ